MNLLGNLINMAMGNKQSGLASLIPLILDENGPIGGMSGLLEKFKDKGLESAVNSWVGSGNNETVSGNQLKDVIGTELIAVIASKMGTQEDEAADALSHSLPHIIDQLTPNGEVPSNGFDASDIMKLASQFLK